MNQIQQNPTLFQKIADTHVDYSEMYRTEEMKQLNKRLRKTRNTLLVCAAALVAGAGIFWIMPETSFTTKNLFVYLGLAAVMLILSMFSNKQPYFSILAGLIICIAFWGLEIFLYNIDDLLIEGAIHKLFIISLLVACFHSSREAELIRRELQFS
jgi:hypothetical protein